MTLRQVVATFALGTGFGVALAQGHDVRLDEAMAALQKAAALVEAARTGTDTTTDPVPFQTQHEFDKHRAKALASIQDAMDHVAAAAAASDAAGSQSARNATTGSTRLSERAQLQTDLQK